MGKSSKHSLPPRGPKITLAVVLYQHLGKILSAAVIIFIFSRADPKDIPDMWRELFASDAWEWAGWIVAAVIMLLSVGTVIMMRNLYKPEIARLTKERDELQARLLGTNVQHSN